MSTQLPITTAPVGHSLFDTYAGKGIWVRYTHGDSGRTEMWCYPLRYLQSEGLIYRADDGSTRWSFEGKTDQWGGVIHASIPDSQMPDGETFSEHHQLFENGKWRIPVQVSNIAALHESASDHDVQSAIADFCVADSLVDLRSVLLETLTSQQRATHTAKLRNINSCIDALVKTNSKYAIEDAYTISVQHAGHPDQNHQQVEAAQAFADKWLAYFNAKPDADLGSVPRYAYNIRLRQELLKDATRTGDARFLIRRAVLVDSLSSPLLAPEVTLDALFDKLKAALTPSAEG